MFFPNLKYKTLICFLINIIAGVITVFGFAPYNMWYMSLAGLVLLCITYSQQSTAWKAFFSVFVFCVVYNLGGLWWITHVLTSYGQMPIFLSSTIIFIGACYLAILPSLAGYVAHKFFPNKPIGKNIILLPILWVLADYVNGRLFTGFSWSNLGYTQIDSWLSGYAPLLGVEGVTLILLFLASNISYFLLRKKILCSIPVIFIFLVAYFLENYTEYVDVTNEEVSVALMQGNIPIETKWNPNNIAPTLNTYYNLTLANKDAQIIVWPESAVPALENDMENPELGLSVISDLDEFARNNNLGLITGIQYYDRDNDAFYNGMIGIGITDKKGKNHYEYGKSNRYYKRHLVPLGEFVPFQNLLRKLGPIFNMPMSSFTRGSDEQPNIEVLGYKVASAICYEIIFNYELLNQVEKNTNMIVTISNDGWFNYTNGPYQHLAIARMRAKEFNKPVLRATNNGITAVIDYKGNIVKEIPQNVAFVLRTKVMPTYGETPFAKYGRLPMYFIILGSLFFSYFQRKKKFYK